MAERQSGQQLKILKTDGGGEFNSREMSKFCVDKGIVHEVTTPYTPQHNELAERRNHMLLDMTRCMLKGRCLPHHLWGEAVSTTTYLLNKSPTKALPTRTSEEAWSGKKPDVQHLKIFDSIGYKHVPNEMRKKLDDRSETLILLGYHPTSTYRLYDPKKMRVVISRDVIVDEYAIFRWPDIDTNPIDQTDDVVTTWLKENKIEENKLTTNNEGVDTRRSQRTHFPLTRLAGHELFNDSDITYTGDIVHYVLLAGAETLTWEQAIGIKGWKDAMLEIFQPLRRTGHGTWWNCLHIREL